ncbi:MAG: sigma 54-interacting transcriptional regulator [Planctomycetota bacterium]|nr:sigma 54-interacting transcriptional regulator [Planctomycetota bacterium]
MREIMGSPAKTRSKASRKNRRPYAKLIVHEVGKDERIVELASRISSIGRSHENEVEIDDINSSRRHCQIERHDGAYEIVDLKSRNGTLVNGILVLRKALRPGDCIEVGKTRMFFEHVSREYSDETIDLSTDGFLEPLTAVEAEGQLDVLKKEREIFLKLLEINRNLNSKVVLEDLLELIVDTVVEVTGAERGMLLLVNGSKREIRAARNMDREVIRDPETKFSMETAAEVVSSGVPVLCQNAAKEPRFRNDATIKRLGLKSLLCVSIRTGDVPLGAIYVDNRFDEGAFTENHRRWLEIVGDQAAVAIRNARLFDENRLRENQLQTAQNTLEKHNFELQEKVLSNSLQLEEVMKLIPRDQPKDFKYDYSPIVTRSPKMYDIFRLLDKVSDSSVPVLVLGESGTGKELIARALHQNGPRSKHRFVSENCAAIPINLMESEFFGHVRGAFTGATRDKRGLFEVADEGTLFLDEIADTPQSMQTKLLRVLQEGEMRRVGGKDVIKVNVRIISATNKNIYELVRRSEFREDLFYRINVITITLPPLRERREDIPLLIDYFLDRVAARTNEKKRILERETFHLLYQYDWPGNVRELQNEMERLAALSDERIEANLLSPNVQARGRKRGVSFEGSSLKQLVARTVEDVEMQVIRSTLIETAWKKSKAAEVLGISRPTLDAKIDKYKLTKEMD